METPAPPGTISGQAPLYVKPEPLNPDQHSKLGLLRADKPYEFARNQHFVPVLATEIAPAALCYPVIFAGDDRSPIAVMGLNEGENVFYDLDGLLRPDVYLPAYVRRYPFTAATADGGERMVICIDRGADVIGENPDLPFFVNGELTQYSKDCIKFCEDFEADRAKSLQFVNRMRLLDLFEHREATFTPRMADGSIGETQVVAGFFAISEIKLNALPVETYIELRDLGYMQVIYSHLMSMMHWDRLIGATIARRMEIDAKAATSATKN